MLTDVQCHVIRRRGIATLHDYRTVSPMRGEPFLEDGILAYHDGRMLLVCAQPLRHDPSPRDAARALIQRFVGERCIDSVLYVAPEPLPLQGVLGAGFVCDEVRRRVPRSAELFLPATAVHRSEQYGRVSRQAARRGLVARKRRGGIVDVNHLALVERFYSGLELSDYLAEAAASLPIALASPDITIIEAWEHGTMKGFVTVHEPFDGLSIAVFIAHDRVTHGVSDFLYAELVGHAHASGSEFVNVGPSPTEGHYRFKRKWSGVPLVPPYYAATWRHDARCARHRTWLLRILGGAR